MNFEEQVSPSLMRAQTTPSERIGVECVCVSLCPLFPSHLGPRSLAWSPSCTGGSVKLDLC